MQTQPITRLNIKPLSWIETSTKTHKITVHDPNYTHSHTYTHQQPNSKFTYAPEHFKCTLHLHTQTHKHANPHTFSHTRIPPFTDTFKTCHCAKYSLEKLRSRNKRVEKQKRHFHPQIYSSDCQMQGFKLEPPRAFCTGTCNDSNRTMHLNCHIRDGEKEQKHFIWPKNCRCSPFFVLYLHFFCSHSSKTIARTFRNVYNCCIQTSNFLCVHWVSNGTMAHSHFFIYIKQYEYYIIVIWLYNTLEIVLCSLVSRFGYAIDNRPHLYRNYYNQVDYFMFWYTIC